MEGFLLIEIDAIYAVNNKPELNRCCQVYLLIKYYRDSTASIVLLQEQSHEMMLYMGASLLTDKVLKETGAQQT